MEGKEDLRGKAAHAKGKDKRKSKKKALKENKAVAESEAQGEEKSAAGPTSSQRKQAAPNLLSNQGQGSGRWRASRGGINKKIEDDPNRGVFRTEDAGFLRSS